MPYHKRDVIVDNRDPRTTWLWISPTEYIEVDPINLVTNMVENCFEPEDKKDLGDTSDLQALADFLNEHLT